MNKFKMDLNQIKTSLCRCCHTDGQEFKALTTAHSVKGINHTFLDLLQETFGLEVLPVEGNICDITYNICNKCIDMLHSAWTFKNQVSKCEDNFRKYYDSYLDELDNKQTVEEICEKEINLFNNDDHSYYKENAVEDYKTDLNIQQCESTADIRFEVTVEVDSSDDFEYAEEAADTLETCDDKTKQNEDPNFYTIDDDMYCCDLCEQRYTSIKRIHKHLRSVHNKAVVNVYSCQYCSDTFTTTMPRKLVLHKLQMHNIDERSKCTLCDEIFNTPSQLRKHKQKHRVGERLTCKLCNYSTTIQGHLTKHVRRHMEKKQHKCDFCNKLFNSSSNLRQHVKIHTGEKDQVCTICGDAFVQKASLNYHMNKYHSDVNNG